MKFLFKCIKKITISAFVLYIYDYFAIYFHMSVPINWITLTIVSMFDLFGLVGLVFFKYFFL
ncbi:MAG: pro-sigmaK processing inhibitor BofA family protein [Bacilli bacterium]|nr:pro-sigmaK processing inhibitor BofA family protein [Bacilli bacterium]